MWMNTEIVALNTNVQTYFTPWFPKGADNGVFAAEVLLNTLDTEDPFVISVATKNLEDEGSAPYWAGDLEQLGSSAIFEATCTELKQLVRLAITFQASSVGQGFVLRALPPTWFDTAV